MRARGDRRRLLIHVGAPKTGTTYLQNLLWRNKRALAASGVRCPGNGKGDHHRAALDLRKAFLGGAPNREVPGTWDRMAALVRDCRGDAVISSELFAVAEPRHVAQVCDAFADHEIHVIFTMRDIARQVPAVWQEMLKNRGVRTYEEFLADAFAADQQSPGARRMWRGQDPRFVLDAWGAPLPSEHVHVITVPPSGAPADTLWRRFCEVLDVDPSAHDTSTEQRNEGLDLSRAEFLRRVNVALPRNVAWPTYHDQVKKGLARDVLGGRGGAKITLPPELVPAVKERSVETVNFLREQGYDIVGDLGELDPPDNVPSPSPVDPQERLAELLEESTTAVARLVGEVQRYRTEAEALRGEPAALSPRARLKVALVRGSERTAATRALRRRIGRLRRR